MTMYQMTGIRRPKLDVGKIETLADAYATAASGFSSAHGEAASAVNHVLNNNEGRAASAFQRSETGTGSITHHLGELAQAARRTESAYRQTAAAGGRAVTAMDIVNRDRSQQFWRAQMSSAPQHVLMEIVSSARSALQILEAYGASAVSSAFSGLDLPGDHVTSDRDERGRLDPRIEDEWAKIVANDPERAQEILQQMADEYADANDIPRIKIDFTQIKSDPGWITYGDYRHNPFRRLRLNTDVLSDPNIIFNTVIHEMEHARQYQGMDPGWFSPHDGQMSNEEAQRWRELNEKYVRNKGDDPSTGHNEGYGPRPIEVGARDAGRDYVNNLSWEEFEDKYL